MAHALAIVLALAAVVAAVSVYLLVPAGMEAVSGYLHRVQARTRLVDQDVRPLDSRDLRGVAEMLVQDLARRGIPLLSGLADRILGMPAAGDWLSQVAAALRAGQGLAFSPGTLCQSILGAVALLIVLSCLLGWGPFAGLVLSALALAGLHVLASRERQRVSDALMSQLPDALDSLGVCFSAGLTIAQAFQTVAEEADPPLSEELDHVVYDLQGGRSVQEALDGLEARSRLDELRFIAVALEIQNRTGGSFRPILEGASRSVMNTLELKRLLSVQTAQARLSARVVTIMPVVLLAILSVAKRSYLAMFFSSSAGLAVFGLAVVLEVVGLLSIRKILAVEVD